MIRTLRSELIKLRTVLVHWVLAIVAIAFPIVVVTLNSIFADLAFDDSSDVATLIAGLTVVTGMLLGAMSAISLTAEYAHNTIRPTYAATPTRPRVVLAKLVVNSLVIAVLSAISVTVSWAVASVIRSGRDRPISLGDPDVVRPMVAVCLLAVVICWFGFAFGLVIRNSPATVTIFLLWPLLIEGLVGGLLFAVGLESVGQWLPYRAGISSIGDDSSELGWPGGLLWFAAVSTTLVALGTFLDNRRDA